MNYLGVTPNTSALPSSATFTTVVVSATNNALATICRANKAGTLVSVGALCTAVTSPPVCRASVQGNSAGHPDGTVLGGASPASVTFTPSVGWAWHILANPIAVSKGQQIALVVDYSSGTVGASNNATFAARTTSLAGQGNPYATVETTGTWAASPSGPSCVAAMYSDGTVLIGTCPVSSLTNSLWNSGTTATLVRGNKWIETSAKRIVAADVLVRPTAISDFAIRLYVGASDFSASGAIAAATEIGVSADVIFRIPIDPTVIPAGSVVRLCVVPTTANNFTTFVSGTCPDLASLQSFFYNMVGTTGNNGAPPTWTDSTADFYPITPVYDESDSGGGMILSRLQTEM